MPKELPQHNDLFGQPLAVGDAVVFPSSNAMEVGMVDKIHPKMVKISCVSTKYAWKQNKYPVDLVKVSGPEVTMYLLKNQR